MWHRWAELFSLSSTQTDTAMLVMARLAPVVSLPFFTPRRGALFLRGVVLLALTFYFVSHLHTPPSSVPFILQLVSELTLGVIIWASVTILFASFSSAGAYLGQLRGGTEPQTGLVGEGTALSDLFNLLAILLFFASGAHLLFIKGLGHLFLNVSPGSIPGRALSPESLLSLLIKVGSTMFTTALLLSLPLIATAFMTDLTFGILARFYPSINAYFLSMPLKGILYTGIIMLTIPLIPLFFAHVFQLISSIVTNLQL